MLSTIKPMGERRTTLRLGTIAADIGHAGAILRAGGLVAIPTETVYGLAANALDATAVEAIFAAKQRPHWDPLIVHITGPDMLGSVATELSQTAGRLADAFWPGPLTMLLPRNSALPPAVTAGRDLVGVRVPAHPVALALIRAADLPLAAPSANLFGGISPTSAKHVLADLEGRIDAVIDAGSTEVGVESTVIDPNTDPITIYREGRVSNRQIEAVSGRETCRYTAFGKAEDVEPESQPSPGVGVRHYAPRANLLLVENEAAMNEAVMRLNAESVAVLLPTDWQLTPPVCSTYVWGAWDNPAELAKNVYAGLRALDQPGVQWIVCPLPPAGDGTDLRDALRDRLKKAAITKD